MAFELKNMTAIMVALKREPPPACARLLILGEAKVLFSVNQYVELARELEFQLHTIPQDLTAFTLGLSLGFASTDTLDVNGAASLTINLQNELPSDLINKFHCVIDAGVLFWCFDPGVVLKNIFRLAKENALFIHITGVSGFYGRCYYSIHPLLFEDFYLGNGCQYVVASYFARPKNISLILKVKRWLKWGKSTEDVTYNYRAGNVFLGTSGARALAFTAKLLVPESDIVPNNAVGTLIFKKGASIEPMEPLLT